MLLTLIKTSSASLLPSPSVDKTDSESKPTYLLSPLYLRVPSAAFICAWLPLKVSAFEPLAPEAMTAPPARSISIMPCATLSCVVDKFPSASLTLKPGMIAEVSWLKFCAPGTTFSGGTIETPSNSMRGSNANMCGFAFLPQRLMSFRSPIYQRPSTGFSMLTVPLMPGLSSKKLPRTAARTLMVWLMGSMRAPTSVTLAG